MSCDKCENGWIILPPKIIIEDGKRRLFNPCKTECLCLLNEIIPKKHRLLSMLPEVTGDDLKILKNFNHRFMIITGQFDHYLMLLKTWLCVPGHIHDYYKIIESANFFENYFMPRKTEGEQQLTIYDNRILDKLFILFTSIRQQPLLKQVMAELIKDRAVYNNPLWIYVPETGIEQSNEYSTEMDEYLIKFKRENINKFVFANHIDKLTEYNQAEKTTNNDLGDW